MELNINRSCINACLLGSQKTSGGYEWHKVGDDNE